MTRDQVRLFETHVESTISRYHIPGLAVAIAREGELVYGRGFGYRDVRHSLVASLDTVFGLGSVTKSFTALAVLHLQESGLLSLLDPVARYLPEFRTPDPAAGREVTIRHFLTHTSGLPPLPLRWRTPAIDTYERLMQLIAETPWTPLGPPGQYVNYSNEGYALLGAIIERVSGLSYPQYVWERILKPAGLAHTGFHPGALAGRAAVTTLYGLAQQPHTRWTPFAPGWAAPDVWLAAGGACSTARDLIRYLEVYRTGGMVSGQRVVSGNVIDQITRPQVDVFPGRAYGYGLAFVPDYHGCCVAEHEGGRPGISAHVMMVRDLGLTAVVLANLADLPVRSVSWGALNLILGLPADAPSWVFPEQPSPRNRWAAYLGKYWSEEDEMAIRVTAAKTGLVFAVNGNRRSARPIGEDAFAVREEDRETYARFLVDTRGHAWALATGLSIIPRDRRRSFPGRALAKSIRRALRHALALRRWPKIPSGVFSTRYGSR